MKNKNIQTKRNTGKKSGFSILHARTRGRKKQRAAMVGSAEDLGADVPNVSIGRALIVILVLHIVAIVAVFVHTKLTNGQGGSGEALTAAPTQNTSAVVVEEKKREPFTTNTPQVVPQPAPNPAPAPTHSILPTVVQQPTVNPLSQPAPSQPSQVVTPNHRYPTTASNGIAIYKVKSGDSAWRIATNHKMTVDEFLKLNNKTSSAIKVGEKVKVKK